MSLEDLSDSEHEDGAHQNKSSNLNSTKDLSSSKLFSSGVTAAGTTGTLPAQVSKTMNSKAQLIDKSLANNANLVKVMDQKLINNRTRAMHQASNFLQEQSLFSVDQPSKVQSTSGKDNNMLNVPSRLMDNNDAEGP